MNTSPVDLGPNPRLVLPLVALITMLSIVASAAIVWAKDHNAVEAHTLTLTSHDNRLRRLEENSHAIAVMATDILWMRRQIEQQQQQQTRSPRVP